jgi:hypothetical protein
MTLRLREEDAESQWQTAPSTVYYDGRYYRARLNHFSDSGRAPAQGGTKYWTDLGTSAPSGVYFSTWNSDSRLYVYEKAYDQVINSYFFENRHGSNIIMVPSVLGSRGSLFPPSHFLKANVTHWHHNSSFDGTSGVGVGPLSKRPSTCTTGVGYWASDQGTWNQSGGDNLLSYSAQGILYRCVSTNTWEKYYEPYRYPHPLRGGSTKEGITPGSLSTPTNLGIIIQEN